MPSPSPLHRYGVGGVINQVGTRTPVFTVGFVIVHTHAGHPGTAEDPPFIFHKQRVLAGRRFGAGSPGQVHRIAKFVVTPFTANREKLINRRQRQRVSVDRIAFGSYRAAVAGFLFSTFSP